MNELTTFLTMLSHSNEDFIKHGTADNYNGGEDFSCIVTIGRGMEFHFDKKGQFTFCHNTRMCSTMTCIKGVK